MRLLLVLAIAFSFSLAHAATQKSSFKQPSKKITAFGDANVYAGVSFATIEFEALNFETNDTVEPGLEIGLKNLYPDRVGYQAGISGNRIGDDRYYFLKGLVNYPIYPNIYINGGFNMVDASDSEVTGFNTDRKIGVQAGFNFNLDGRLNLDVSYLRAKFRAEVEDPLFSENFNVNLNGFVFGLNYLF